MAECRRYEIDGMELVVPLRYDEKMGIYIEDYREWMENVILTPAGNVIMFAGEDACEHGKRENDEECRDCGTCVYYRRAGERSWIGICTKTSEHSYGAKCEELEISN
ncbi:MAG: hypothetical protein LUG52_07255 [Clostridia bacterium]|nr:hypothetical protein [Clostridia bacterium]